MNMSKAAMLAVDINRAHFDMELNYLPVAAEDAKRVIENVSQTVMPLFRERNLPVLFVTTGHKINPIDGQPMSVANPLWRYQMEKKAVTGVGHKRRPINTVGSPAAEIMPQLDLCENDIVVHKQRYSPFMGTPLEMYIRVMGIDTLFIVGANTNNCVLCTAFEAYNRDLRVIVVEDCCASMNGPEYHQLGLTQIRASLGWVVRGGDVKGLLDGTLEL